MKKNLLRRLPDSEFEIMKAVWESSEPATTASVMEELETKKGWKAPTVISFLLRLVERGFLRTEKPGRERIYFPLVSEEDYLQFETERFVRTYHNNSSSQFINTLIKSKEVTSEELDEIEKAIASQRKRLHTRRQGEN